MRKKDELKVEKIMKINRALASRKGMLVICSGVDILIFILAQYLFNLALNVPDWVKDLSHPEKYIGIRNIWMNWNHFIKLPGLHIGFYLLLVVGIIVFDIILVFKLRLNHAEEVINAGQKGTSRWTTNEEIQQQYKEIPDRETKENKGEFDGAGGTIISRIGNKLYIDQKITNNLILGMTRSGKGEMFVISSIDVYSRAKEKTSLIVTDPKLELFKSSKQTLESRGYLVYLLNLEDPIHSMGFNPLDNIVEAYLKGDYDGADELAQAFSFSIYHPDKPTNGDDFWTDTSTCLLAALILAHVHDCIEEDKILNKERKKIFDIKREKFEELSAEKKIEQYRLWSKLKNISEDIILEPKLIGLPETQEWYLSCVNQKKITMYSIVNTFTELGRIKAGKNSNVTALDLYFNKRPMLDRAKIKYSIVEQAGEKTKGSIITSALTKLIIFTTGNIAKMTAESSFNLEDVGFGEKPIAIFIGIPFYEQSKHFIATTFIRQLSFVLGKKATRSKTGECSRKVKFICDEFGNLPAIEGLSNDITAALGYQISYDLYIQSYRQIDKLYGEDAITIKENCGNQIYILTNSMESAKEFSDLLGDETYVDIQRSGEPFSNSKTYAESTMSKPLLTASQLMELEKGENVIKRSTKREDIEGNNIRPHPIFNSSESGKAFLYRYMYLTYTFPNPKDVDLHAVNQEDRSYINHRERVWDYNQTFYRLSEQDKNQQDQTNQIEKRRFGSLKNKEKIMSILKQFFSDQDLEIITDDTILSQLIKFVQIGDLRETEKKQLEKLIYQEIE